MEELQNQEIGSRIAELRRAHKLTQEVLAEKLNVSTKHISHVERGCASLSLRNLVELCRIFDCSLDYIIFGQPHDSALSQLPDTILEILYSGQNQEIDRLIRYLQIYAELYKKE
jgi:transcriptional regulator with XRE-family HTH domain